MEGGESWQQGAVLAQSILRQYIRDDHRDFLWRRGLGLQRDETLKEVDYEIMSLPNYPVENFQNIAHSLPWLRAKISEATYRQESFETK
jgi:hypothetical protein